MCEHVLNYFKEKSVPYGSKTEFCIKEQGVQEFRGRITWPFEAQFTYFLYAPCLSATDICICVSCFGEWLRIRLREWEDEVELGKYKWVICGDSWVTLLTEEVLNKRWGALDVLKHV